MPISGIALGGIFLKIFFKKISNFFSKIYFLTLVCQGLYKRFQNTCNFQKF
jgi:predicted membrane channel-forming protein YqfA (hemolysin III family)